MTEGSQKADSWAQEPLERVAAALHDMRVSRNGAVELLLRQHGSDALHVHMLTAAHPKGVRRGAASPALPKLLHVEGDLDQLREALSAKRDPREALAQSGLMIRGDIEFAERFGRRAMRVLAELGHVKVNAGA